MLPVAVMYVELLRDAESEAVGVPELMFVIVNLAEEVADEPMRKSFVVLLGWIAPFVSLNTLLLLPVSRTTGSYHVINT